MDIESRNRWVEYSKAKDTMFSKTHIPEAPGSPLKPTTNVALVELPTPHLSKVPYEDMTPPPTKMPKRPKQGRQGLPLTSNSLSPTTTLTKIEQSFT